MDANAHAELHSKHGNTDVTELMISTKKRSAKFVQNKLKKSPSANVDLRETLKDTTTQEMIRLSSLQLRRRKNTRYARSLNPESQEDQTAKHHFRKAQKKSQAVQIDG